MQAQILAALANHVLDVRGAHGQRCLIRHARMHFHMQAEILAALTNHVLDVRGVRREVDRREACGQWLAGAAGEGGAFAMRSPAEAARAAAAAAAGEVVCAHGISGLVVAVPGSAEGDGRGLLGCWCVWVLTRSSTLEESLMR
jgi:hypothetical protein